MATTLPTDYTDATWTGNRKYKMINNSDGTVSFEDVTEYTNKENSFFGASDANAMNAAVNELNTNLTSTTSKATDAYNRVIPNISFGGFSDFAHAPGDILSKLSSSDVRVDISKLSVENSALTTSSPKVGVYPCWYNIITFGFPNRCTQIATEAYHANKGIWIRYQHDSSVSAWTQLG